MEMYQPASLEYLNTATERKPDVYAFSSALPTQQETTLDVVVQYAAADVDEEDELLDDPEDGKLAGELADIIYGKDAHENGDDSTGGEEPLYGRPDFTFPDDYSASLFREDEELPAYQPLLLYQPIQYEESSYFPLALDAAEPDYSGEEREESESPLTIKRIEGNLDLEQLVSAT